MATTQHERYKMTQDIKSGQYHGRNWSYRYRCPCCNKEVRQNTNFLGRRVMVCDGLKVHRISRQEWVASSEAL